MLLATRSVRWKFPKIGASPLLARCQSSQPQRQHDPLNVLFCGSDQVSIYSLHALHEYRIKNPDKVADIQVLCRPDKRVGRGLKQVQEVPIKSVARELGLRIHQIDTFKDWSLPPSINLVVAVSFGLLVPVRVLNGAKHGGLNVHPSLLPDLRGPAPIMHTLLKQRPETGVTLQTMHPTQFDHGTILSQTTGIKVPPECPPDQLLHMLGPLGAELLCRGIENGLFLPPLQDIQNQEIGEPKPLDHAPKITPEDRHIDWNTWNSDHLSLRDRVLGRLWDTQTYSQCTLDGIGKRVSFRGPWEVINKADNMKPDVTCLVTPGRPLIVHGDRFTDARLGIGTVDGNIAVPSAATIEGEAKDKGLATLFSALSKRRDSYTTMDESLLPR